jgi:hypothetical protein
MMNRNDIDYMLHDDNRGIGYDPTDRHSFPYQAQDPPFDATSLGLPDVSPEKAAELDPMETIDTMIGYDNDGPSNYRMLDMALRTFYKLCNDSAYYDIAFPDLFAACCEQAMIWENG